MIHFRKKVGLTHLLDGNSKFKTSLGASAGGGASEDGGGSTDYTIKPDSSTANLSHPRASGWIAEYDNNIIANVNESTINSLLGTAQLYGNSSGGFTSIPYEEGPMGAQFAMAGRSAITSGNSSFIGSVSFTGVSGEGYTISHVYEIKSGFTTQELMQSALVELYGNSVFATYGLSDFTSVAIDNSLGVHHVMITVNGTTVNVYQDGSLVQTYTTSATPTITFASTSSLYIPSYNGTGASWGWIGTRMWNRPLSLSEVLEEFAAPWELLYG